MNKNWEEISGQRTLERFESKVILSISRVYAQLDDPTHRRGKPAGDTNLVKDYIPESEQKVSHFKC